MRYHVDIGDATFEVVIDPEGISLDGRSVDVSHEAIVGTDVHSFLIGRESHRILAQREGAGRWDLQLRGRHYRAGVLDEHAHRIREMIGRGSVGRGPQPVRAPMPGVILKIEVREGDLVESGRGLVIVEAMKMENELIAEVKARVGAIHVIAGQAVAKDEILMDMLSVKGEQRAQ